MRSLLGPLHLTYQVEGDRVLITPEKTTRAAKDRADLLRKLAQARKKLANAERLSRAPSDPATAAARSLVDGLKAELARLDKTPVVDPAKAPESSPPPGRKRWTGPGPGVDWPREGRKVAMPEYVVEPPDIIVVEVLEALEGRPITGEHLVRPDGKVSLGFYGEVYVAGLTTTEVKEKIALHLREFIQDEKLGLAKVDPETGRREEVAPARSSRIFVDVAAYNSKVYYVQGDVGVPCRLPLTGSETVLDAINYAGGLIPGAAKARIRLVRPAPPGAEGELMLPVDLSAIVDRGQTKTNYQLFPTTA